MSIEHGHSAVVDLRYMHPGKHNLTLEVSDGNATFYWDLNFIVEGEMEGEEEGSHSPLVFWVALIITVIVATVLVIAMWMRMKR